MESDGLCLIEKLMEVLDEDELEVAVTVARRIWLRRNSVVHGGIFYPPARVAQDAKEVAEAFVRSNEEPKMGNAGTQVQERLRWKRPPEGMVKIKWDAALDKPNKRMGVDVVV